MRGCSDDFLLTLCSVLQKIPRLGSFSVGNGRSGRKRWFISPPSEAIFSKKPILQWLEEDYPALRESKAFWECEQRAGDVLYVPCEWGHAVLNVEDTIGLAVEFKYRYTDGT